MATCSQAFQNKRRRDEYSNGGLASPHAKRNSRGTLGCGSDLVAVIQKIDNMDNNEERDAVNEVEMKLNGVTESLEDEIGLKVKKNSHFEYTHEKRSTDQMGSNKQGELTVEKNSEWTTSVTSDLGNLTHHDDVLADLDLFVDHITPDEFGIMMQNYFDRDSVPDIMYSDTWHGYIDRREGSYGSLWEDDLWVWNEHPIIRNNFAFPQQK